MRTRERDPKNLGPKEDWAGNCIAFHCPFCGKLFIVGKQLHGGGATVDDAFRTE